jgi:hypothetical protein
VYYPICTFQLIGAERSPIVQNGDCMSGRQGISAPLSCPASPGLMRWVAGSPAYGLFPVTQDEHEDDAQDEHVEPDIPGAGSAVRAHGGAAVLTVTR